MPGLLDLPPEILEYVDCVHCCFHLQVWLTPSGVLADQLLQAKSDYLRWDQFPLDSYAEDCNSTSDSRTLANLSQANRQLRHHFKPVLWRDITLYYVSDIEKLDRFLGQSPPSHYGKHVRNLMLSWWDDIVGNEMQAEADISTYEEEELGLGTMHEWMFNDRIAWGKNIFKSQLRTWHPEWSETQVDEAADEPSEYPYTSGPDGRGPVPRMDSISDVESALQRILEDLSSVKHLDWNARLLKLPPWLPPSMKKLESLVLFHDDLILDHCSPLLRCCQQLRSLTLLDFKHDLQSDEDLKVDCINLKYCSPSPSSPLGIVYKTESSSASHDTLCRSLLAATSNKLHTLTLSDWKVLRIERLLPVFLSVESLSAPGDERHPHYWDSAVDSNDAALRSLEDLRNALGSCHTLEQLVDRCVEMQHLEPIRALDGSGKSRQLDMCEFAQWLSDDAMLAERAFLAIQRRRSRQLDGMTSSMWPGDDEPTYANEAADKSR